MTIKDEDLKLKEIDQLSCAVLGLSKNCFEIKKLCITVILAIISAIISLNKNGDVFRTSKKEIAIILAICIILFLIVDSQAYYYQKKLRLKMSDIEKYIINKRNLYNCCIYNYCSYNLQYKNNNKNNNKNNDKYTFKDILKFILKAFEAIFNWSQLIYYLVLLADLIYWIFY